VWSRKREVEKNKGGGIDHVEENLKIVKKYYFPNFGFV
jgi:hypothetical protein